MGKYSGSTGLETCTDCEEGFFAPTHSAVACLKCAAEVEVSWEGIGRSTPLKPTTQRKPPSTPYQSPPTPVHTHPFPPPAPARALGDVQLYSYGPNYTSSKGASYCDRCLSTHYMTEDHKCKAKGEGFETTAGEFTTLATLNVKEGE